MISQQKLDFYIENNINVLFIGRHGTGKTSAAMEAYNRHGLKAVYFSVPTMDPWVDFVGVPTPKVNEDGTEYLDLVRPRMFANDEVEAIFLDEFNRGSDKVRNACLELIQFKSINGKKFNNLRFIWAAINPEDDITEYDVAKLDWAQKDRFVAHVEVEYDIDKNYFSKKYGDYIANNVYSWWNKLTDELKYAISPRRMEYAIQMYQLGGDLADVLPRAANVTTLINTLRDGPIEELLIKIMDNNEADRAVSLLKNDTKYTEAIKWIVQEKDRCEFFIPLINKERMTSLLNEYIDKTELANICSVYDKSDQCKQIIYNTYTNYKFKQLIQDAVPHLQSDNFGKNVHKNFSINRPTTRGFMEKVNEFNNGDKKTATERVSMLDYIKASMGNTGEQKNGNLRIVPIFVGKQCRFFDTKENLLKHMPSIFDVLNFCLKEGAIDIRTEPIFKMVNRILIEKGMEDLVWIPN